MNSFGMSLCLSLSRVCKFPCVRLSYFHFCRREVKMLHLLASDHVVRLVAHGKDPELGHCIVLERGFSDLATLFRSGQSTAASRRALAVQLLRIMKHLRAKGIVATELDVPILLIFCRSVLLIPSASFVVLIVFRPTAREADAI